MLFFVVEHNLWHWYQETLHAGFSGASAREAPWVRKIGNPSSRENLVMTSAYEQASVRPYGLRGRGRGVRDNTHCYPNGKLKNAIFFRGGLFSEKSEKHSFLFAMSTNDRRG